MSPYTVSTSLGGISTVAGGDVTISAGQDVISFLPGSTTLSDAGSGAFGPAPGVVTIKAGGNVYGHYVAADSERNGQIVASTINAGINAGTTGQLLALSLVKGGWDVSAPNGNIVLQEVRNPNGVFSKTVPHQFDYDLQSFVDLDAGDGVELFGGGPRNSGSLNLANTYIYPPSLSIDAGMGGITFNKPVTLFPSAYGELSLTTSDKGPLIGTGSQTTPDLLMSDSGSTSYTSTTTFGINDHKSTPVQIDNYNPVVLDIAGDMNNFFLVTPKETQIAVHGDMNNSYFQGQNLHSGDVTSITVDGKITIPNSKSFYALGDALSDAVAAELTPGFLGSLVDANGNPIFPGGAGLVAPTFYSMPGGLSLAAGKISTPQFQALVTTDASGNQVLNTFYPPQIVNGVVQTDPATGKILPDLTQPVTILNTTILNYFYQNSPNISVSATTPADGLILAGQGLFKISADSVDLGYSLGIQTLGAGYSADGSIVGNGALIHESTSGAAIQLDVTHDLTMFSSTIATAGGGDINITAGGSINVGSSSGLGLQNPTSGIFAAGPGNITVTATGTIDIAGSRIATFDGGNITLLSLQGDVNVGDGAANDLQVYLSEVNPLDGSVVRLENIFNGSGILAYTLPLTLQSDDGTVTLHFSPTELPGNITVTTPQGSIISGQGGIVQEPLNGNESSAPIVDLKAGTHDGSTVIYPGDIDLGSSGLIGGTVKLDASRNINGPVIGIGDVSLNAVQNIGVTVLSGGTVSLSAGGTATGTLIGVTGISVGGGDTGALSLLSQNVSVGGAAAAGLATTASASAASQSATQEANTQAKEQTGQDTTQTDDDEKKKRGQRILLAKSTGRVTVILPK